MQPAPHPEPPADLDARALPLFEGEPVLYRSHRLVHDPIHYSATPRFRFDSPAKLYRVLYAAWEPECAFIETFGWITGNRRITTSELAARGLAELKPERPLRLVDLHSSGGLARIGADAELISTRDYAHSRRWAEALFRHPARADGILYPARHDPSLHAVALFDRGPRLDVVHDEPFLTRGPRRALLAGMLVRYGFALIETRYEPQRKRPRSGG